VKDDNRKHPLRNSGQDVEASHHVPDTPQTRSSAYRLEPEMGMDEQDIRSTIVLFGGARIPEPAKKDTARTKTLADLSKYYAEAREFARLMTERSDGHEDVIVTGGGPGVMEAGNRGAVDAGGRSIGLNIVLPHEQAPNEYVTPELCYNFHYFAIRKMHFLMRARAVAVFPGGFGTLDETSGAPSSTGKRWRMRARSRKRTCRCSNSSKPANRRCRSSTIGNPPANATA